MQPIQHRIEPGGARLEIETGAPSRTIDRRALGLAFHRLAGWTGQPYDKQGRWTLKPEIERGLKELRLPATRFYGVADEAFDVEDALDKVAEVVRRIGVPEGSTFLTLEDSDANKLLPLNAYERALRHCLQKGYGFRHWEVANEPYMALFPGEKRRGAAYATPGHYAERLADIEPLVRRLQPNAMVGLPILHTKEDWGASLMARCRGHYDFIVGHYYGFARAYQGASVEQLVITENYRLLDHIVNMTRLAARLNPGRTILQMDTEWGMHSPGPDGERADDALRNGNIVGALHRAVRLICYLREGVVQAACGWQALTNSKLPGYSFLPTNEPERRGVLYWLQHRFARYVGDQALEIAGRGPYYLAKGTYGPTHPVLATQSEDALYLITVNPTQRTVEARIRAVRTGEAQAEAMSQPSPDSPAWADEDRLIKPLRVRRTSGEYRLDLPPLSIVFIKFERADARQM